MAHDAWLRQVIQDLVEPDLVEDVVQETFLAAWLKGQGNTVHNLPGFLRRVGRNLALKHRRREGRRRRREQQAAKDEALPSTGQMLERLQAHRQLTTAVSELGEPYRTTILLRYFEGLTPKQIAVRQGVPASTVRTQLERGLAQLRGRLGAPTCVPLQPCSSGPSGRGLVQPGVRAPPPSPPSWPRPCSRELCS